MLSCRTELSSITSLYHKLLNEGEVQVYWPYNLGNQDRQNQPQKKTDISTFQNSESVSQDPKYHPHGAPCPLSSFRGTPPEYSSWTSYLELPALIKERLRICIVLWGISAY